MFAGPTSAPFFKKKITPLQRQQQQRRLQRQQQQKQQSRLELQSQYLQQRKNRQIFKDVAKLFPNNKIPQVYIYCGGKSGSTTLEHTLQPITSVFRTHSIDNFQHITKQSKYSIFDCIRASMKIYPKIYIIDAYRTPIERNISAFFETYNHDWTEEQWNNCDINKLIDEFNEKSMGTEMYNSMNQIFDHFEIPHFSSFNFKKKYNELHWQNVHFVKLHFNTINEWNKILTFVFKRNISLQSWNKSAQKPYHSIYKKFLEEYKIQQVLLNSILSTEDYKIYNTEEQKKAYAEKWNKKIVATPAPAGSLSLTSEHLLPPSLQKYLKK